MLKLPPYFMLNPIRARFFKREQNIYSYFMPFVHIDMTHIMAADVLATQGARASAIMILT